MQSGLPTSAPGIPVRLILYQFEQTWQTNFENWLHFWDANREIQITNVQNVSEVASLPEGSDELRILIFAAKTESSQPMLTIWLKAGIRYIFSAQQFMRLFRPELIAEVSNPTASVLFFDDDPDRFVALRSVLKPFGFDVFNKPSAFQKDRVTSWLDLPKIETYNTQKWGNRPLLLLNLDHDKLALQPILNSLEHEHYIKVKGEKVLLRPKLLPFKDFSKGSLWDEIQAGIRRFSKVILSFPELLEGIFQINLQQNMADLDVRFKNLADKSLNPFQKGHFADHLTDPAAAQVWPKLGAMAETKFRRLEDWQIAYNRLQFLQSGMSWLWQKPPGELKAPEASEISKASEAPLNDTRETG